MAQWLHVPWIQDTPTVHSDHLGDTLHLALKQQADIGWNNFAKGRISKEWGATQQIFYDQFYPTSSYNAEHWMGKLITAIWTVFRTIWNSRNAHLHWSLDSELSSNLNKEITQAFRLYSHSVSETDSLLFSKPISELLKMSKPSKQTWLASIQIAVHDFLIIRKQTPTQWAITKFFIPTPPEITTTSTELPTDTTTWIDSDPWDGPDLV